MALPLVMGVESVRPVVPLMPTIDVRGELTTIGYLVVPEKGMEGLCIADL